MKAKSIKSLLLILAVAFVSATTIGCKKKVSDADLSATISTAMKADPMAANTQVTVTDGVATLSGECMDATCVQHCEKMVKDVKGVKSVVNNLTVAAPTPPPVITADDPLKTAVNDALTAFPGVTASINDGIVSLSGTISKADRQKLMMAVNALKPKKVETAGLTIK